MNFHDDLLNNIETNSVRDSVRHQSISTCPKFNIIYDSSPMFRQFVSLIWTPILLGSENETGIRVDLVLSESRAMFNL